MPNIPVKSHDDVELRSNEVQDILSFIPSWMIRFGIGLILVIIIGLLGLAWMIKYPEVIDGKVTLTTLQPPIKTVSKATGTIERLLVHDGDVVNAGQELVLIENPLTEESVAFLQDAVSQAEELLEGKRRKVNLESGELVFSEIQNTYNQLVKGLEDYSTFKKDRHFTHNIQTLKAQVRHYRNLGKISERMLVLGEEELEIAGEKYKTQKTLYEDGVVPRLEFYKEEDAFNQKKQSHENIKASIVRNMITVSEKEKQILEMEFTQKESIRGFRDQIEQAIRHIENYINNWQQSYIVNAPIAGRISFIKPLTSKQHVKMDDELFVVIPNDQHYVGLVNIPAEGFGKVRTGQKVLLRLDKYPSAEYGQLVGQIDELSLMSNQEQYRAIVELPKGMITNYKRELSFTPEMNGTAHVVTEDLRLSERILYRFRGMLDRKKEEEPKPAEQVQVSASR